MNEPIEAELTIEPAPKRPRGTAPPASLPTRIIRPLTDEQWKLARIYFESSAGDIKLPNVAAVFNTSVSSVQKRSAAEKWSKGAELVGNARKELQSAINSALAQAAAKEGEKVAARLMEELQPWIEEQKRDQIRRAIKRSTKAQKRLDKVSKGFQVYDAKKGEVIDLEPGPKEEMHIAAAEDKYDNIIRRNLGMQESTGISGNLSVNILAGQAAVSVSQS